MRAFLKLVEIHTKIASVTPFVWSAVYAAYYFRGFCPELLLIFFVSMISFDMFTTGLNNYLDWKRAEKKHGYNYEMHNAIVRYGMKEETVILIISVLFASAVIFGLLLYSYTDCMVLLLGIACFLTGILYSAGPVPISRTPLGEIFSGFVMGYLLPFIVIYFTVSDSKPVALAWGSETVSVVLNWKMLIPITMALVPTTLLIAGIMLANNICDIEDDIVNRRYTLPVYIGKRRAMIIFNLLYALCYLDIVLASALGYLPPLSLLVLASVPQVARNLREFGKIQTKKDTFKYSVDNLVIVMASLTLSVLMSLLL